MSRGQAIASSRGAHARPAREAARQVRAAAPLSAGASLLLAWFWLFPTGAAAARAEAAPTAGSPGAYPVAEPWTLKLDPLALSQAGYGPGVTAELVDDWIADRPPAARMTPTAARAPTGAAAPTQPENWRKPKGDAPEPQPGPVATIAGWDFFGAASLAGALRRQSPARGAASGLLLAPSVRVQRQDGVSTWRAAAEATGATAGAILGYRAAVAWNYAPRPDLTVSAGVLAGRTGALQPPSDPERWAAAVHADVFSPCPLSGATCDVRGAWAEATKWAGDVAVEARASAVSAQWRDEGPARARFRDEAGMISLRASWRRSATLVPFMEASGQFRRAAGWNAGRRRLIAGVQAPELSLLSGVIYAGVDAPQHGPAMPVLGGELAWTPRRSLLLGLRAETGSTGARLPDAAFVVPPAVEAGPLLSVRHRPGRMSQAGAFLRWSPRPTVQLSLAAGWSLAQWRSDAYAPGERLRQSERAASVSGRLKWVFARGWSAGLDLTAAWIQRRGHADQRFLLSVLSLRKDFGT